MYFCSLRLDVLTCLHLKWRRIWLDAVDIVYSNFSRKQVKVQMQTSIGHYTMASEICTTALFNELRQRFPEVPPNVVSDLMYQVLFHARLIYSLTTNNGVGDIALLMCVCLSVFYCKFKSFWLKEGFLNVWG